MTDESTLADIFPDSDKITEITESPGTLYKITHRRKQFDDETLLVRLLSGEPAYESLLETDTNQLETVFYDNKTPNQWNIQLFWAYEPGAEPDPEIRTRFERNTRFAIRRCVPIDSLADFVTPLQRSLQQLEDASPDFQRSDLLDRILSLGLGFLFDGSTNRDKKFEELLELSLDDPTPDDVSAHDLSQSQLSAESQEVERQPIEEIDLGPSELEHNSGDPFRPDAQRRTLQTTDFTLVYGPNGSGKTSLFDGAAMGMVGQIKHSNERVDAYPELGVTQVGDTGPLDTESDMIASRIAQWYGFRPYGRQNRHLEFYRVNYHEAGATTRLLESDSNLKIEQTLRRFLFGEELVDARTEKRALDDLLEERIDKLEDDLDRLKDEKKEKQQRKWKTEKVFSTLASAARDLSPGGDAMLSSAAEDDSDATLTVDNEKPSIAAWTTLRQRIRRLDTAAGVIDHRGYDTAGELKHALDSTLEETERELTRLETAGQRINEEKALRSLAGYYSDEGKQSISADVAYVALLHRTAGFTQDNLSAVQAAIAEIDANETILSDIRTVSEWRTAVREALSEKIDELTRRQEQLSEIKNLQEQQRQLQAEIRRKTEEYIKNEELVSYCPACYSAVDGETILQREKPPEFHTEAGPNEPADLQARLDRLRTGQEILSDDGWAELNNELKTTTHELASINAFRALWADYISPSGVEVVYPDATTTQTESVKWAFATMDSVTERSATIEQVLNSGIAKVTRDLESLQRDLDLSSLNLSTVADRRNDARKRAEDLKTGLAVLRQHYPNDDWHRDIDVHSDYQLVRSTIQSVEGGDSVTTSVLELTNEIESLEEEIESITSSIKDCEDRREYLTSAFEVAEGEGKLQQLVKEHMDVVGTLFKAFQRPYEFESVKLADEELQVIRRGENAPELASDMSSGQRAALALAIFITNNLAHDTAPPIMLLDEPFAHLDDINTISFFNLLIELAIQGERQVLFATANENIADLLERKIGESDAFDRVPVLDELS
jgi:exonuclease SbcC